MLRHKLRQPPMALLAPSAAASGPAAPPAHEEPPRQAPPALEQDAHPHADARADADADADAGADVDAWLDELTQLHRRERQLLDRLEMRRAVSLKSVQPPPGAPGVSTASSTGSDELAC